MPTTTEETRETAERSRATASRAQRSFDRAERDALPALRDLVAAWTDALRLFVPPVLVQPETAVRVAASAFEQMIELQRDILQELLSAGNDTIAATDVEQLGLRAPRNGRAA